MGCPHRAREEAVLCPSAATPRLASPACLSLCPLCQTHVGGPGLPPTPCRAEATGADFSKRNISLASPCKGSYPALWFGQVGEAVCWGKPCCEVRRSGDLGALASLCDFGLLTAPLWASTSESVDETAEEATGQLRREEHADEAPSFVPLPPSVWSLEMQPQHHLGACWKGRLPGPSQPPESEPAF